jgi:hypothetical protein
MLPNAVAVAAGQSLRLRYSRRVSGSIDGLTCEVVEQDPDVSRSQTRTGGSNGFRTP